MSMHVFLAYLTILCIATVTPGPSMLLALNHGVNYGFKRSLHSCCGNVAGNLLMALVSFTGLGVILAVSGVLFGIIKIAGAAYLVYTGLRMISGQVPPGDDIAFSTAGNINSRGLFIEGFIIAIGNPKGILFFTALFPQFISINNSSKTDLIPVFGALAAVAFTCYMLYAAAGRKMKEIFSRSTFRKRFNIASGLTMIGSGIALAFADRNK